MYTREQVAKTIDHAVLKPFATDQDVIDGCKMCDKFQVASCCVRPSDVPLAVETLKDSSVMVSVVVGFPHGSNTSQVKALEVGRHEQEAYVHVCTLNAKYPVGWNI